MNLYPASWFKKEGQTNIPVHQQASERNLSIGHLHEDIDRLFNDTLRQFGDWMMPYTVDSSSSETVFRPNLDIQENEKEYCISIETPGVEQQDINIELQGDTLVISGEKKHKEEEKKSNYHRIECSYGSFQRMLTLPENANLDEINANYDNGILTVTIMKNPEAKTNRRSIEIKNIFH